MKIKRNISLILILLLMMSSISSVIVSAFDETSESNIIKYVDEDIEPWLPLNYSGNISSYTDLPTSYDPRKVCATTPVKNQNPAGSCGIFATVAAFEHTSYKLTGLKYVYSEESPRMILSYRLGLANNSDNENAFYKNSSNQTWNFKKIASYLSIINQPIIEDNSIEWVSPNLAIDVPYTYVKHDYDGSEETGDAGVIRPEDNYWPSNINNSYANAYVTGTTWVPDQNEEIKRAVWNYGAVYTTMLGFSNNNSDSYNESNAAWYTTQKTYSHAVTVVGWDDDYPVEKFNSNKRPPGKGAWLVKNSWGIEPVNGGYWWISYYDESFNSAPGGAHVITDVQPVSKNEYTLGYDFAPITAAYPPQSININSQYPYVCYANIYNMSDYLENYGSVSSIMFYDHNVGCDYEIYVLPMIDNTSIPSAANLEDPVFEGTVENIGYNNAELKEPLLLDTNYSRYAFIVKVYASEDTREMVTYVEGGQHSGGMVNPGESYRFVNGTWQDIAGVTTRTTYGNVCIRPTLLRRTLVTQNSQLSTTVTYYNDNEITVNLSINGNLLYSISNDGNILYEDKDFTRNGNSITFSQSYFEENGTTSVIDLDFKFTDGENQTLKIYPKALSDVTISGKVARGQTLTANVTCSDGTTPTSSQIAYQWQSSSNGSVWIDINGANSQTYTLTANEQLKYIRCSVSADSTSTMIMPATKYSTKTSTKVILYGDVDLNGSVSDIDATVIQEYLAKLVDLTDEQLVAADVNGDGEVSVLDAASIRMYVAQMITLFPVEE